MKVTITCKLNPRHPGLVYATVSCAADLGLISATLDYCLSACKEYGYTVDNADEVLQWLNNNVTFSATN